jgi:hypothetical protein
MCSRSCGRGVCADGYKDTGFRCGKYFEEKNEEIISFFFFLEKYNFNSARCLSQGNTFCSTLISHSECYPNDNRCVCSVGYYQDGDKCGM